MKRTSITLCLTLIVMAVLTVTASAIDMFIEKELTPIVSVEEPKGGGSKDIYIINDGIFGDTNKDQYDTYCARTEPSEDFIGYIFPKTYTVKAFEFTEGNHFWDGGWFEMGTQRIEILKNGEWKKLENVKCDPEYPVGLFQEEFGEGFETYMFTFDPVECDGIRIAGMAGGQASFISCAEIRVLAVVPDDYVVLDPRVEAMRIKTEEDLKAGYISRLFTPFTNITEPKGGGNHDINVINDLEWLAEGEENALKQYDTYIAATEPYEVWFGYDFGGKTYSVYEVEFHEGMQFWDGGWFSNGLTLEVLVNGTWTAVPVDSGYPVSDNPDDHTPGGQTYVFTFDPIQCQGVRIIGTAGGEHYFVSVSELRVKGTDTTADSQNAVSVSDQPVTESGKNVAKAPQTLDPIMLISFCAITSIVVLKLQITNKNFKKSRSVK